jgi:hypothetical protein
MNVIKATAIISNSQWEVTFHQYDHPPITDGEPRPDLLQDAGVTVKTYGQSSSDERSDAIEREAVERLVGTALTDHEIQELLHNNTIRRKPGEHRRASHGVPEIRENLYWRRA